MTTVLVLGSCLTNLACLYLMADYKWERPNNAAVLRSDHFVDKFLDRKGYLPPQDEFSTRVRWKPGLEKEGARWLNECYRDTVGHLEIPPDKPGLFETLDTRQVDLVLMDNLHDSYSVLLHSRPRVGEPAYSLPFSLSRCENEQDLVRDFYYGSPLEAADSVKNWLRIIKFIQEKQPHAQIIFYCAHACTSVDIPDRYERLRAFHALLAPRGLELGITVMPPFELPPELTKMPEDRDHFETRVYRAMAGQIFLAYMLGPS
jgi:hypothetical protein